MLSLERMSNFLASNIEKTIVTPMLKISGTLVIVGGLIQGESACYAQVKKLRMDPNTWQKVAAYGLLTLGILSGAAAAVTGGYLVGTIAASLVSQIPTIGTPLVCQIVSLVFTAAIAGAKGYHTFHTARVCWAARTNNATVAH